MTHRRYERPRCDAVHSACLKTPCTSMWRMVVGSENKSMRRREFITLVGGAAAWPLSARAQQPERLRRVGVLLVTGPEPLGPFREALGDLGYVEGKNIQIEVRSAQGKETHLPELAAELV